MRTNLTLLAAGAALAVAGAANADFVDIDLTGWIADAGWGDPANTSTIVNLPVGTEITGAEYIDLTYESFGISWNSELVLSLNDSPSAFGWWDVNVAGAGDNTGVFGPVTETFSNSPVFTGAPFTMTTDELSVETYASWTGSTDDYHEITTGTLRVHYNPIPAPGALALLGMAGLVSRRRRRG